MTTLTVSDNNRVMVSAFYGGDKRGPCIQITEMKELAMDSHVQLTLEEAADVARALLRWLV